MEFSPSGWFASDPSKLELLKAMGSDHPNTMIPAIIRIWLQSDCELKLKDLGVQWVATGVFADPQTPEKYLETKP